MLASLNNFQTIFDIWSRMED